MALEKRDLQWPGFVIGVLVTLITLRAGVIVAGTVAGVNSTDFLNRLDLHSAYLLWGALPVAAVFGGLAVGLTPRRLGGNGWTAFLTPFALYLTIVGIRNQLTISTTLLHLVLLAGLSHLAWRLGRFLSRLARGQAGRGLAGSVDG